MVICQTLLCIGLDAAVSLFSSVILQVSMMFHDFFHSQNGVNLLNTSDYTFFAGHAEGERCQANTPGGVTLHTRIPARPPSIHQHRPSDSDRGHIAQKGGRTWREGGMGD